MSQIAPLGLTSLLLLEHGFRHAFFMRRGGVSVAPYESLNFSSASGDPPNNVAQNLRRAADSLGVAAERIYYLSQEHGIEARVLTGSELHEEVLYQPGDITLSLDAHVGCGVRMADCAAVLVGDVETGAVAAIHSGWRGTVAGVAASGVAALRNLIGGRGRLIAAIGPHIEQCCFEVGADVASEIAAASSLGEVVVDRRRAKPHVDLRQVIEAQLRAVGLLQIDQVAGCTVCDAARFHSYRRDGKCSGRMLAAIVTGQDCAEFG